MKAKKCVKQCVIPLVKPKKKKTQQHRYMDSVMKLQEKASISTRYIVSKNERQNEWYTVHNLKNEHTIWIVFKRDVVPMNERRHEGNVLLPLKDKWKIEFKYFVVFDRQRTSLRTGKSRLRKRYLVLLLFAMFKGRSALKTHLRRRPVVFGAIAEMDCVGEFASEPVFMAWTKIPSGKMITFNSTGKPPSKYQVNSTYHSGIMRYSLKIRDFNIDDTCYQYMCKMNFMSASLELNIMDYVDIPKRMDVKDQFQIRNGILMGSLFLTPVYLLSICEAFFEQIPITDGLYFVNSNDSVSSRTEVHVRMPTKRCSGNIHVNCSMGNICNNVLARKSDGHVGNTDVSARRVDRHVNSNHVHVPERKADGHVGNTDVSARRVNRHVNNNDVHVPERKTDGHVGNKDVSARRVNRHVNNNDVHVQERIADGHVGNKDVSAHRMGRHVNNNHGVPALSFDGYVNNCHLLGETEKDKTYLYGIFVGLLTLMGIFGFLWRVAKEKERQRREHETNGATGDETRAAIEMNEIECAEETNLHMETGQNDD